MKPKDCAIELLAKDIPTVQIAAAVGVDPSYISQLKADPEVQARIAELQATSSSPNSKSQEFDELLDKAELLALEKIERSLHFATFGQALAAFRILNGARRRLAPEIAPETLATVTVTLTLPPKNLTPYILNTKSEIVEVEGRTLLSASPNQLNELLAAKTQTISPLQRASQMFENITIPEKRAARTWKNSQQMLQTLPS